MGLRRRVRHVVTDLWSDGRGWILVAISLGHVLTLGIRVTFPALLPRIKAEFLLTNTTAGLLLTILWVSFATAQLPGGVLTDWIGERNTLMTSAVLATLSVVLIVLSPDLAVLTLALVLFGLSSGLFSTPRITVLSDIYPDRAGTAIGINAALGNFGNAVIPVVATVVAGLFAWRIGVGFTLPAFLLFVVGVWLIVPVRTSEGVGTGSGESRRQTIGRILAVSTGRPIVVATCSMILVLFVWQGYTAFVPTYLVEVKGLPQSTAAMSLGAFFVSGGAVQPFIGDLSDRYDERRVLVAVMGVSAIGLAAFPFANSVPAFIGLSMAVGMQLAYWPIIFAYVPRVLPDDIQGSGFGLLRTVFQYFGATGPFVVGALADATLFDESFLLLAGLSGLAMVLSAVLPRVAR